MAKSLFCILSPIYLYASKKLQVIVHYSYRKRRRARVVQHLIGKLHSIYVLQIKNVLVPHTKMAKKIALSLS